MKEIGLQLITSAAVRIFGMHSKWMKQLSEECSYAVLTLLVEKLALFFELQCILFQALQHLPSNLSSGKRESSDAAVFPSKPKIGHDQAGRSGRILIFRAERVMY
ncbi:hypothetical protein NPIL_431501 [Nephila pilipes]|uniref:Uncharacterized protein n=1 Tax=Nephila pilipes TaxID=299642 RepID=A0A8X6NWW9_NEPPI|nr:hypothetical protein NPIL_431501 [Nephila pilipes]